MKLFSGYMFCKPFYQKNNYLKAFIGFFKRVRWCYFYIKIGCLAKMEGKKLEKYLFSLELGCTLLWRICCL